LRSLHALILLILGLVLIIEAGWKLDFAIFSTCYIYIPFIAWGVPLSQSDAVNIAYIQAGIGLVPYAIGSFLLGYRLGRKRGET